MNCLGRNLGEPERSNEAAEEAEEVTRRYEAPVVGSVRSRGVAGVKPGADNQVHSKGSTVYRKGNVRRMPYSEMETTEFKLSLIAEHAKRCSMRSFRKGSVGQDNPSWGVRVT